ncbi:MAG: anhydro-N-acetylmuramic acid kinase [Nannocystaceae bacterium]|nr:anhydro-N-acetylmuramic acid kinase [Nannocystaceae bacterium]
MSLGRGGVVRAIGLMSGTSCDGVDALLLELAHVDERHEPRVLGHAYVPFPATLRAELRDPAALTLRRVAELHFELPRLYHDAVRELPHWQSASVCGMHGQTVWHAPPSQGSTVANTLQLGSSGALAALLGMPVVGDMRGADVARGGEGAPIAPFSHWFFTPPSHPTRLVVNIGGIANYTCVTRELERVSASDIGPGMMISDALARHVSRGSFDCDRDGELSEGGDVYQPAVDFILDHPFFARPSPRSTGREDFGAGFVAGLLVRFGELDGATLLRSSLWATATAIVTAAREQEVDIGEILLTGGGARHPGLREMVAELADPIPVVVHDGGVFAPEHHEPAAMALIAARTLARLPSSLPQVTGAREPAILGHVHY